MKVYVDKKIEEFKQTDHLIKGGQISGLQKFVFISDTIKTSIVSNWRYKTSVNFLSEYLGFVAYQALGITVPDFRIGFLHEDEPDSPGAVIFLQEYLEVTETSTISIGGQEIKEKPLENIIPLIFSIAILGDTDGFGINGDNILLEIKNEDGLLIDLIKIDCGRTFERLNGKNEIVILLYFNRHLKQSRLTTKEVDDGKKNV